MNCHLVLPNVFDLSLRAPHAETEMHLILSSVGAQARLFVLRLVSNDQRSFQVLLATIPQ
jgi:hypothetical protein